MAMTRHRSIWLPKFDRDADYIVFRTIQLGNLTLLPGTVFDRTLVTVRRHRLLYESRKLKRADQMNEEVKRHWGLGNRLEKAARAKVEPELLVELMPAKRGRGRSRKVSV